MDSNKCYVKAAPNTKEIVHIYLHGEIENFEDYGALLNIDAPDQVQLYINCPGGDCSVGFFIIDRLSELSCPIHVTVEYPSYSMGAIIALCGTSLVIKPDAFLMFHDYTSSVYGKGNDIQQQCTEYRQFFKDRFARTCAPFLSNDEIENMFKGQDIYVKHNSPGLKARLKRHFKPAS